jgi:hypothetical protein
VAVGLILCELVVAVGVMLGGTALAGRILDIDFGSLGRAALKLCATAVFAAGVGSFVAAMDRDSFSIGGLVLAWNLSIILYWIAFAYFFSLELQETVLTVAIVGILQAVFFVALWSTGD